MQGETSLSRQRSKPTELQSRNFSAKKRSFIDS